jgi:hypothetical protein
MPGIFLKVSVECAAGGMPFQYSCFWGFFAVFVAGFLVALRFAIVDLL